MEIQVHRVSLDQKENKVHPDQPVPQAPTGNPEDQVHQASTETRVLKETQVPQAYQVHQVKVSQARQAPPVSADNQDPEVTMVNPVQPVIQVPQDHLVKEEPQVPETLKLSVQMLAQPVPQVHQALQA